MLINGIKFACATCIKGHRASNCKHTDRPLFEIRKKGRPVSQCPLCRDLRKTKQLHIKCICNKKKQEAIIINKAPSQQCGCQHQQKSEILPSSSSTAEAPISPSSSSTITTTKRVSPVIVPSHNFSSSSTSSSSNGSTSPSYSWALVSPSESHCQLHSSSQDISYVFQKSTNRERQHSSSAKRRSSSPLLYPTPTHSSPFMLMPPVSSMSSSSTDSSVGSQEHHRLSSSSILDDYLANHSNTSATLSGTTPLSRSMSSSSATNMSLDHDMMKELDDDLCNLLDNMIHQQRQHEETQQDTMKPASVSSQHDTTTTSHTEGSMSPSASTTSTNMSMVHHPSFSSFFGHCQKLAQWHPQSPPPGQVGESVIITMTPLPKWHQDQQQQLQLSHQTSQQQHTISTTRIVTCYCGKSCTCPGCLVHPTSSIFASQDLDPYAGYPVQYSVSSDED